MREGDIEILICRSIAHIVLAPHETVHRSIHPRESNRSRDRRSVPGVVEVLDVVGIFESEPFVGRENIEGAEG